MRLEGKTASVGLAVLLVAALCAPPAAAQRRGRGGSITGPVELGGTFEELKTRPGVVQSFVLIKPRGPAIASAILFTGGTGRLDLSPAGIGRGGMNFLVRNRERFAEQGLLVAVVDTPSDRTTGLGAFRLSEEHAEDMKAVMAFLRQAANAPVWLIGTSRGTVSAASVAARLKSGGADGLVLTSSVVRPVGESLNDVGLEDIRIPTLVVHHRHDDCRATPYAGAALLPGKLTNAPKRELLTFDGGDTPRSDPCEPESRHGFLGLDAEVVKAIVDWIKLTPTAPRASTRRSDEAQG